MTMAACSLRMARATLGAANAEVLGELGYTEEERVLLFERSVV